MKKFGMFSIALALLACRAGATRIGVFSTMRGGESALASSTNLTELRSEILASVDHPSFVTMDTVTPETLRSLDVLFLCSVVGGHAAIDPLSLAEQTALSQFVANGGTAILIADNDTFAGGNSDPANQSLLNPFGIIDVGTSSPGAEVVMVNNTNPITNGPHGSVTSTTYFYAGSFSTVPDPFVVLGNVTQSELPGLVYAPKNALSSGSGGVIAFSDSSFMFDTGPLSGRTLILNAMSYGTPLHSIAGTVSLESFGGTLPSSFDLELRAVGGGGSIAFTGVPLSSDGSYYLGTRMTGDFEVWGKASHWLGKVSNIGVIHTGVSDVTGVNFSLPNGDCDGDNEITLADYAELATAFGLADGDPGFDPNADLDGDGEVTLADYSVLASNFGEAGD